MADDVNATMNNTVIAVVGVLAVAALIAFYIWSSHNRYYITSGSQGVAYEVDKKTGKSWMLYGGSKVAQRDDAVDQHKEQQLPYDAASKVTGNAGISYGYFSGKLYNGSDWTVTRVIFSVSAKESDGTIRWTRDFSENLTIKPLSTGEFIFEVSGGEGIKEAPWAIKSVFGYKE